MKIAIRVDCSTEIGMGHVMRCLAIAQKASSRGHDILFIGNNIPPNFVEIISDFGFKVESFSIKKLDVFSSDLKHGHWLKGGIDRDAFETSKAISKHFNIADWLIVDHYGIDQDWEYKVQTSTKKIAIIDDLADRKHISDILLDQNIYENWETKYKNLVPKQCKLLVGGSYILLRDEFIITSPSLLSEREKDLIVFMGGGDEPNFTGKILEALIEKGKQHDLRIDVVVGPINRHKEALEELIKHFPFGRLLYDPKNIAELYLNSKIAIGAPGGSTWERCSLGVPSILIAIADNQLRVGEFLNNKKISWVTNSAKEAVKLYYQINKDHSLLKEYACKAKAYVDGEGVKRFIKNLEKVFENV
ncbi:TPA: UDP-2,4-diacetamido-2,4,6-trideoxy-beta-L-altropyranose hydrolase [Vibrio harveyi]|nr:UDP-2,4-diacetamido-2,4,6-trideoxy-beta-L-altropyranose hydrolase [Vibrio harveyi]